jgi:peptidoglycan hydrolase CwlO-like protein
VTDPTHSQLRDLIHEHNTVVTREIGKIYTSVERLNGKVDVIATKQDDLKNQVDGNISTIREIETAAKKDREWLQDQRRALTWGKRLILTCIAGGGFLIATLEFFRGAK